MIAELLLQPERKTLEFKRDLSSPKPLLKTLVAFANTAGGRLIVGVADDHQVLGMLVRLVVRLAELLPVLPATEKVAVKRPESRLESALAAKVLMMLFEAEAGKVQSRMLGNKSVSGELHKQIKRLLILKFIEMTLPEIPNSRLQKYRLTDLGLKQFNKQ